KILILAFEITPGGTSTFQDVPTTHWSYGYIAALADNGIALGDNGNFRPYEPVTRAQFVAFMYRALNK
ncbi:MAG: S-layer homology domain-containing protein, partial [Solibacillus sp.]